MKQRSQSTKPLQARYLAAPFQSAGAEMAIEVLGGNLWLVTLPSTAVPNSVRTLLLSGVTPLDVDALVQALELLAQRLDAGRTPRTERVR